MISVDIKMAKFVDPKVMDNCDFRLKDNTLTLERKCRFRWLNRLRRLCFWYRFERIIKHLDTKGIKADCPKELSEWLQDKLTERLVKSRCKGEGVKGVFEKVLLERVVVQDQVFSRVVGPYLKPSETRDGGNVSSQDMQIAARRLWEKASPEIKKAFPLVGGVVPVDRVEPLFRAQREQDERGFIEGYDGSAVTTVCSPDSPLPNSDTGCFDMRGKPREEVQRVIDSPGDEAPFVLTSSDGPPFYKEWLEDRRKAGL